MMLDHASSEFVCAKCFNDEGLQEYVANHAESNECDFCGDIADKPIAAPFDDLVEHIAACIGKFYDDPSNAGLAYETREGGWQGATYTTDEIFDELSLDFPNDESGRLRDEIASAMPTDLWSDAEPYRLNADEQLRYSWEAFCRVIKYKLRYFFVQSKRDDDEEIYGPREILQLIFSYAKREGAFVTIPRGTHLYRARHQPAGETYASAAQLGSPPAERAIQTNRMSPPGIVMTYLADDAETALAETANAPGTFALGEFVTERDALILDLTQLPPVPSVFAELSDTLEYDPRPPLNFLHAISREISRPIARDDRVHIEYVPTQVVTEYVRTTVTIGKQAVEGIRYKSSRAGARTAVVLFADRSNLVLEKGEQPQFYHLEKDHWLRLHKATANSVSEHDIARWSSL